MRGTFADIGEITSEWLTAVLRGNLLPAGATVQQHEATSLAALGGIGSSTYRITLSCDDGVERSVICKLLVPPDDDMMDFVAELDAVYRELRFYRDLAPLVRVRIPKAYHAAIDEERTEICLLLEDLGSVEGPPVDFDTAAEILDIVAGLHAAWWHHPVLEEPWLSSLMEDLNVAPLVERVRKNTRVLTAEGGDGTAYLVDCAKLFVRHAHLMPKALPSSRLHTLVHGDLHPGNVVRADEGLFLIDWQLVQRGNPSTDVAVWIGDYEDRHGVTEARELMQRYLRSLVQRGVRGYGMRQLKSEYLQWMAAGAMSTLAFDAFFKRDDDGALANLDEFERISTRLQRNRLIWLFRAMPLILLSVHVQVGVQKLAQRLRPARG